MTFDPVSSSFFANTQPYRNMEGWVYMKKE